MAWQNSHGEQQELGAAAVAFNRVRACSSCREPCSPPIKDERSSLVVERPRARACGQASNISSREDAWDITSAPYAAVRLSCHVNPFFVHFIRTRVNYWCHIATAIRSQPCTRLGRLVMFFSSQRGWPSRLRLLLIHQALDERARIAGYLQVSHEFIYEALPARAEERRCISSATHQPPKRAIVTSAAVIKTEGQGNGAGTRVAKRALATSGYTGASCRPLS